MFEGNTINLLVLNDLFFVVVGSDNETDTEIQNVDNAFSLSLALALSVCYIHILYYHYDNSILPFYIV